ncbi:MAG: molybdopterin-dependent oxidoreductase [Desulfurococcus sp.]|uniref:molybdopterin-dependent oxidoreductase n=1 Tax=Desulfurococcus sp. TaxID=51678 RepID=UPI003D10E313
MVELKCYTTANEGLKSKGVEVVVDCVIEEAAVINDISDVRGIIEKHLEAVFKDAGKGILVFDSNESIGSTHMLYRFKYRALDTSGEYISVRIIVRNNRASRILFTIPRGYVHLVRFENMYNPLRELHTNNEEGPGAPGQTYIPNMIVYNILGVPSIDVARWRLEVVGSVEKPVSLSLKDLYELGVETLRVNFHCVTGWSVGGLEFTGVRLSRIMEIAAPRHNVKWMFTESLDGYTTIVPYSDGVKGIVALEMNGKPLDILHGYPARLIIPHLYGWKSAKWVSRIILSEEYRDGYWEALGYHPRGRVDLEERFKRY